MVLKVQNMSCAIYLVKWGSIMLKQDIILVNNWMFCFLNIPFFFASLCQLHTMEYPYVQTEKFISGIQLCTLAHWMLVQSNWEKHEPWYLFSKVRDWCLLPPNWFILSDLISAPWVKALLQLPLVQLYLLNKLDAYRCLRSSKLPWWISMCMIGTFSMEALEVAVFLF